MQLSIERCLKTGRNIQRSINAFRWANYLFNATTVDLAEKNNLRNKISLWLTKKLPINKRTKRKLEIFLTMTGNNEKKIIKDLFERKERSLQRGYYSTRLKASSRSEKTNIINCLKAIYNRYAEMSENKNSKYSVFINSLATNWSKSAYWRKSKNNSKILEVNGTPDTEIHTKINYNKDEEGFFKKVVNNIF